MFYQLAKHRILETDRLILRPMMQLIFLNMRAILKIQNTPSLPTNQSMKQIG